MVEIMNIQEENQRSKKNRNSRYDRDIVRLYIDSLFCVGCEEASYPSFSISLGPA